MSDLMSWLLLLGIVPNLLVIYIGVRRYNENRYRSAGYEPVVDEDALETELAMEFGPLSVEQGARFQ
ncbi:hypothetical protein ACLJYM_06320 [Rhizobium giardinii]|uniref:hypothetical protein n=1 Tax=Rhizobium giardinii TaxID=56731 RepID=UPI0039DF41EF